MKKLLVLCLVLGFAASANAVIYMAPANTGWDDVNQNGVIDDSDIIYIGVVTLAPTDGYDLDLHVTGPGTLIEVNGGPLENYAAAGFELAPPTYAGIQDNTMLGFSYADFAGQWPADTILFAGLAIHCDGEGDVIVDVTLTPGGGATRVFVDGTPVTLDETMVGRIVIPQVPEPMTLSLLGLGGLALIRRRR
jgi:hypothetical protein